MRILSVSHYYLPHVGGIEVVAQKQAISLAQAGHQSIVVTTVTGREKASTQIEDGVRVIRCKAWNIFDWRSGLPFPIVGLGFITAMRREVRQADIVHIHDVFYQTSWWAYFWALCYRKPVTLTQHVGIVQHASRFVIFAQKLAYVTIGKAIFRKARTIIVYNYNVKAFLLRRGVAESKIHELRNGIDIDKFKPVSPATRQRLRKKYNLSPTRPIVLFVGRLVSKKGYDKLFEARSDDFDLVFAASGHPPPAWQELPHVYFMGTRTQSELVELYQLSDVFALPTVGEMFTLAMQEAMASGLPIVTTNDPAYKLYDINQKLVKFVEPTPAKLKKAIEGILQSPKLRADMSAYSRSLAERWFNWKANISEVTRLLEAAVGKKPLIVTTSWDDSHTMDVRLAKLLKKYSLPATFYITPNNREFKQGELLSKTAIKKLSADFEIGAHTLTHPRLPQITDKEAKTEIAGSKAALEAITGKPVHCFCYPRGEYTSRHAAMVKQAGYSYARTVRRTYASADTENPLQAPTTIHAYNHVSDLWAIARFARFNPWRTYQYVQWDNLAIAIFERMMHSGGIFHLWGHSWEIDNHREWDQLERVFKHIAGRKGVRYVSNRELV